MSQRFRIAENVNGSKNTRLPVSEDFSNYRFNRDELAHISRYLFVVEHLVKMSKKFEKPLKVLDIGCGDIYIARVLQASFVVKKTDVIEEYVGFDIDNIILDRAEQSKPNSFPIRLELGDVTTGGLSRFADKEFDVVICLETVEHIKPEFVLPLLKEIKRVGSFQIISTPNFDGGTGQIPEDHIKEWPYAELQKLIDEAGLKVNAEIGTFCNLNTVERACAGDKNLTNIYEYLKPRMDANFLSIAMAKFLGKKSQNILRLCE